MSRSRRNSREVNSLARERIKRLFKLAEESAGVSPELSSRYVRLARRISMSRRIRLDREYRRRYCRYCNTYFIFGKNVRVRIKEGMVVVTCLTCGRQKRYRVVKESRDQGKASTSTT